MRLNFLSLIFGVVLFALVGCSYNDDLMEEYKAESEDDSGDVIVQSSHDYRNNGYDVVKTSLSIKKTKNIKENKDSENIVENEDENENDDEKKAIDENVVSNFNRNDNSKINGNECFYIVQNGDTLYGLSKKTKTKISAIKERNSMDNVDFNIKVGQKLKINCGDVDLLKNNDSNIVESSRDDFIKVDNLKDSDKKQGDNANSDSNLKNANNNSIEQKKYTIKQGDTFYGMSRKFNIKTKDIYDVNGLNAENPGILKVGSTINLPSFAVIEASDSKNNVKNSDKQSIENKTIGNEKSSNDLAMQKNADVNNIKADMNGGEVKALPEVKKVFKNEKYIRPINTKIVSNFGKKKKGLYNDGLLFDVDKVTKIVASKSGYVFHASFLKNYNNLIIIKHNDGYLTIYGNVDKTTVKRGDVVSLGQEIGTVNPSVSKTFYFAIRNDKKGNKPVDPLQFIK